MSGTQETQVPVATEDLLETFGVNTHIPYTDGEYADIPNVISDLEYLGIDQVRDSISDGANGSAPLSSYIEVAKAGIHFTFLIEGASTTAEVEAQIALIDQVEEAVPGSVTAVEGPNEVNNYPVTYNGVSGLAGAVAEQEEIYSLVHSDANLAGVSVDYFTGYDAGSIATGPDPDSTAGLANYDNQHPYPNLSETPAAAVARLNNFPNLTSAQDATAPVVYTETGYSTNDVSESVQENYTLDLLMDAAQDGVAKTYLYDLMDAYAPGSSQGDDGYGLFDYTKTAKPVATAIHNLTTLLADDGADASSFTPTSLTYTISGLPSYGHSMLLEKSNGTYIIAIWAEPQLWNSSTDEPVTTTSESVTLTLAKEFSTISVYDPTLGTSAISSKSDASSVTVTVTDHPLLVELSGAIASNSTSLSLEGATLTFESNSNALASAETLVNTIAARFSQSQTATPAAGSSVTATATSAQPVLDIGTIQTTVTAANYAAIIDSATGSVTIRITNDTAAGTSILAGSGGGAIKITDNSAATIVAGDGNYVIGDHSHTGNLSIVAGNGNDTINDVNSSAASSSFINTGTGDNLINLAAGAVSITLHGHGDDTVNAGYGSETVSVASGLADNLFISENSSHLVFDNGTGATTIRGGDGATTIAAGGAGGSVFFTAEQYNYFPVTGTPSDSVTDISGGNDTLVAGSGNTTINAAQSTGDDLIRSGTGDATLIGSTSASDVFQIAGITEGSHSITIENWTAKDTLNIQGFDGAAFNKAPYVSGGNTIVTLNDGTKITFMGITNVSLVTSHMTVV